MEPDTDIYTSIARKINQHQEFLVVHVVDIKGSTPAELGSKMIINSDLSSQGTIGGGELEHLILTRAEDYFKLKKSHFENFDLNEISSQQINCGGQISLFIEYFPSPEKLFIFGYGHVAKELILFLKRLDWNYTVIDHRKFSSPPPFLISQINYHDFIHSYQFPPGSYYLIMTPSHQYDYQVLQCLLKRELQPKYIGLLASSRKARNMMSKLVQELCLPPSLSFLFSPVGLDLGGKKLPEIALSIASQLQLLRSEKTKFDHLTIKYEDPSN
ncbi:MAG: hypothetical protein APR63_12065 [Desulfuromonas sp. SDB]|nr:MAG: hypothetical protein APR63_12065 [Desulfuromonas sp. SDB]